MKLDLDYEIEIMKNLEVNIIVVWNDQVLQ